MEKSMPKDEDTESWRSMCKFCESSKLNLRPSNVSETEKREPVKILKIIPYSYTPKNVIWPTFGLYW